MNTVARAGAKPIIDLEYVKARLWRWAAWTTDGGWYRSVSLTGRLMQGVRSNICPGWIDDKLRRRRHDPSCPDCAGSGRLALALHARPIPRRYPCVICDAEGKFFGDWCFRCQGTKTITVIELEVNPASLRSTRYVGRRLPDDVASAAISALVAEWLQFDSTVWWNRVIIANYLWNGTTEMKLPRIRPTQQMKARKLRISCSFFEKRLHEAHYEIEQLLDRENL